VLPKNQEEKPQDENPEQEIKRLTDNPLKAFMDELKKEK